jgi:putative flippase GtrA
MILNTGFAKQRLESRFHLQYLLANLPSIAVTSLANFFVCDLFVFRR